MVYTKRDNKPFKKKGVKSEKKKLKRRKWKSDYRKTNVGFSAVFNIFVGKYKGTRVRRA